MGDHHLPTLSHSNLPIKVSDLSQDEFKGKVFPVYVKACLIFIKFIIQKVCISHKAFATQITLEKMK